MSGYVLDIASRPRGVVRRRKLAREEWEALAYAVLEVLDGYLERHLAAAAEQRVLEALDAVVEIDCDALEAGRIAYIFHEHWELGALCGSPEQIVSLLVAAGASVDARGNDGRGITDLLTRIGDEERRAAFSRALSSSPRTARPGA